MNIFYLEDNEKIGIFFEKEFRKNFDITWVKSYKEAYDILKKESFDLYILDIYLEGNKNGYDLTKLINGNIIILTNDTKTETKYKKFSKIDYSPKKIINYIWKNLS